MAELFVVEIAGRRLALPTAQVRSIAPAGWITPVPTAPRLVAGVTQIRGHIVPVVDIAEPPRPVQAEDPLLVVEYGPARAALRVDRVVGDEPLGESAGQIERLDVGALFDRIRAQIEA
jgi:chemotaxis signal transduction protein